jgi:hypothetical protein
MKEYNIIITVKNECVLGIGLTADNSTVLLNAAK